MEKSKVNWNTYKDQKQQVSLLVASCLLCDMRPFINPPNSKNIRFDEWNFFVDEIAHCKKLLRDADIVKTEQKSQKNNYRSIPASAGWGILPADSFVSGYVKNPPRATKSRLIETVQMYDLIDFAKNNNFEEAYIGLSGNTKEKPMQDSERKALYKMILGMALSKYDLDPFKCTVGKDDSRGSIPCELKELGLSVDRTTVVKHLKAALEEWGDTEDINRLDKFRKK